MALNIKNAAVERLVEEVVALTGGTKTAAVRRALEERRERLRVRGDNRDVRRRIREFLERAVWSRVPAERLGRPPLTREEEDAILGFGPDGA